MTLVEYAQSRGAAVLVLTKPSCPQCTATKRRLTKNGISFYEEPVGPQTIAMAQAEEIYAAPIVVDVGNAAVWGGFQPGRLDAIR